MLTTLFTEVSILLGVLHVSVTCFSISLFCTTGLFVSLVYLLEHRVHWSWLLVCLMLHLHWRLTAWNLGWLTGAEQAGKDLSVGPLFWAICRLSPDLLTGFQTRCVVVSMM